MFKVNRDIEDAASSYIRCFLLFVVSVGVGCSCWGQITDEERAAFTFEGIFFPLGELSFADRVVEYEQGPGILGSLTNYMDPAHALGPPDEDPNGDPWTDQALVSLGCGGTLVLEFTNNELKDIEGPDLHIFEAGSGSAAKEPTRLYISKDGINWLDVGDVPGSYSSIDISHVAPGEGGFHFVKLVDLKTHCDGWNTPGADIDAVGAIGAAPYFGPGDFAMN